MAIEFNLFEGYPSGVDTWQKNYWHLKNEYPDKVTEITKKINTASTTSWVKNQNGATVEIIRENNPTPQQVLIDFYKAQHDLAKNGLPEQCKSSLYELSQMQIHNTDEFPTNGPPPLGKTGHLPFPVSASTPFHGKTTWAKCGHVSTCRCSGPHNSPRTLDEYCPICKDQSQANELNPKEDFVSFKKKDNEMEIDPNTAFQKIYPFPYGNTNPQSVALAPANSGIAGTPVQEGFKDMQKLNTVDYIGNQYLPSGTQDGKPYSPPPQFQQLSANQSVSLGCLMAMVPSEESSHFVEFATKNIEKSTLHEKGIESEPHVTVLYGFSPNFHIDKLNQILARTGPIHFTIGEVGRFECPEYDVIHFKVNSPELKMINAKIAREFATDIEDSDYKYNPHLTLAYVQKGTNKHLDGTSLQKKTFGVAKLLYSPPDQNGRQLISLSWDAQKFDDGGMMPGIGTKDGKPFGTNLGDLLQKHLIEKSSKVQQDKASVKKQLEDTLKAKQQKNKPILSK